MTPEELSTIGQALYGVQWRAPLARDVGVGPGHMVDMAAGRRRITERTAADVYRVIRERAAELERLLGTRPDRG